MAISAASTSLSGSWVAFDMAVTKSPPKAVKLLLMYWPIMPALSNAFCCALVRLSQLLFRALNKNGRMLSRILVKIDILLFLKYVLKLVNYFHLRHGASCK